MRAYNEDDRRGLFTAPLVAISAVCLTLHVEDLRSWKRTALRVMQPEDGGGQARNSVAGTGQVDGGLLELKVVQGVDYARWRRPILARWSHSGSYMGHLSQPLSGMWRRQCTAMQLTFICRAAVKLRV